MGNVVPSRHESNGERAMRQLMQQTINEHSSKCNEALPYFVDMDRVLSIAAAYGGKSCLVWFINLVADEEIASDEWILASSSGESSIAESSSEPFVPQLESGSDLDWTPSSPYPQVYSKMRSSREILRHSSRDTRMTPSTGPTQLSEFLQTLIQQDGPLGPPEEERHEKFKSPGRQRVVLRLSRQTKARLSVIAQVLDLLNKDETLHFRVPRNLPRLPQQVPSFTSCTSLDEPSHFVELSTGECAEVVAFIPGQLMFRAETPRNVESFGRSVGDLILSLAAATVTLKASVAHEALLTRNPRYYNFKLSSVKAEAAPVDGWRVSNPKLQSFLQDSLAGESDLDRDDIMKIWQQVLAAEDLYKDIRHRSRDDSAFPTQLIHGDLNLGNVLVSVSETVSGCDKEGDAVIGILDFELCALDLRVSDLVDAFLYLFDSVGYAATWDPLFGAFFSGVSRSRFRLSISEGEALFDLMKIKVLFTWRYRVEEASFGRRVDYSMKQMVKLNATLLWLTGSKDKINSSARLLCQ